MKTKMRNIAAALLVAAGASTAIASEIRTSEWIEDYSVEAMVLEDWMTDAELFRVEESKDVNSTVVEIAVGNPDFSILVEAVIKAGLAEALSAEGPFTVFAPTNAAFESLFSQLGISGIKDLTAEQLIPILTYHVVSGKVMSDDLSDSTIGTLNEGENLKIDLSDGVKVNGSHVVAADIEGRNGVIHVIDKVLMPGK